MSTVFQEREEILYRGAFPDPKESREDLSFEIKKILDSTKEGIEAACGSLAREILAHKCIAVIFSPQMKKAAGMEGIEGIVIIGDDTSDLTLKEFDTERRILELAEKSNPSTGYRLRVQTKESSAGPVCSLLHEAPLIKGLQTERFYPEGEEIVTNTFPISGVFSKSEGLNGRKELCLKAGVLEVSIKAGVLVLFSDKLKKEITTAINDFFFITSINQTILG